jgi:DNA-binding NarL/FixJ family response regulator
MEAALGSLIKVVVAEDHELVRLGVRMVLARSSRYSVVAETAHGAEVEELTARHDAHVVLLDLALSDCSGLEVAARLKKTRPQTKIVVVTADASPMAAKDAFSLGVDGFLLKEGRGAELLEALDCVMAGKPYLSPKLGGEAVTAS